jgi:putative ABC transport system ATP-binding protein
MIELKNIEKTYRKPKQPPVRAVNRVSLSVQAGEFVAVLGPSGSGKSSTLMNVGGLLARPDAGEYVLDGTPVAELRDDELARVRNRVIGFVFQSYHLLARMTAEENVWQPLLYSGGETRDYKERSAAALAAVGLADRRRHFPGELSGGQQQRVAIARAIVSERSCSLTRRRATSTPESARDIVGLFKQQNAGAPP